MNLLFGATIAEIEDQLSMMEREARTKALEQERLHSLKDILAKSTQLTAPTELDTVAHGHRVLLQRKIQNSTLTIHLGTPIDATFLACAINDAFSRIIPVESPFASNLLGRHLDETIAVGGQSFKIIGIQISDYV